MINGALFAFHKNIEILKPRYCQVNSFGIKFLTISGKFQKKQLVTIHFELKYNTVLHSSSERCRVIYLLILKIFI